MVAQLTDRTRPHDTKTLGGSSYIIYVCETARSDYELCITDTLIPLLSHF